MPLAGDTLKDIAAQFKLSLSRLALFNGLSTMDYPTPGRTLRLIPAPGPITGAKGEATYDARGVPVSYVIAEQDTTGGLEYRFGLTQAQLAEANHVAHVYEQGNVYFMQPGRHIALQLGQ